jgi:hypothetical protein
VLWFVLFAQYRRKYKWAKHETRWGRYNESQRLKIHCAFSGEKSVYRILKGRSTPWNQSNLKSVNLYINVSLNDINFKKGFSHTKDHYRVQLVSLPPATYLPECRTATNTFLLLVFSIFESVLFRQTFYDLSRRASVPVRIRNYTYPNSAAKIPFRFKLNTRWKSAVTSKLPAIYFRKKEQAVSSAVYRKVNGKETKRVSRVWRKTNPGCPELG